MLGLLLGMHEGAPQPMALEPQQQDGEGCVSLTPNVPAAWCDTTCGPAPRSEQCKPICKCPVSELSKVPAPPAPEPRIIGGWTDCGPETGVEEWLAKWVLNPEIADKACKTDEGAISAAFVNPAGKPARDPSYSHAWGSNAILPGRFGGGVASPIVGSGKDYTYHWLTVGGQDTDSKSWMETVEHDVLEAGAKGVAFDIEGGVTTKDMLAWIKTMRPKHPDWTYVHVPDTAEGPVTWNPEEGPDFVAPMMYYSNYNSYAPYPKIGGHMELEQGGESANVLKKLHEEAGWPSSRIILTYQSFDAARSRAAGHTGLLPSLGQLLGNTSLKVSIYGEPYTFTGPYAGVLGWPAQCGVDGSSSRDGRCWPEADRTNQLEVIKGATGAGVSGLGAVQV